MLRVGHGPLLAALLFCVLALQLSPSADIPLSITHSLTIRQYAFLSSFTGSLSEKEALPLWHNQLEELARKPLATSRDRFLGAAMAIREHSPHLVPLYLYPLADYAPLADALIAMAFSPDTQMSGQLVHDLEELRLPSHLYGAVLQTLAVATGQPELKLRADVTTQQASQRTLMLTILAAVIMFALLFLGSMLWFHRKIPSHPPENPISWSELVPLAQFIAFFALVLLATHMFAPLLLQSLFIVVHPTILSMGIYMLTGAAGFWLIHLMGRSHPHDRWWKLAKLPEIIRSPHWKNTCSWIPKGYAMLFPVVMAASFLSSWLFSPGSSPLDQPIAVMLVHQEDLWIKVMLVVSACILAPLVEEPLFRGFVHNRLRRRFSPNKAALLSGLAFALIHFQLDNLIALTVIGYTLGLVYEHTKSLLAPMLIHSAWNLGSAVAILVIFTG